MQYPSEVIASALALKPEVSLPIWKKSPTHCSHCGIVIAEGEPYSPLKAGAFFSDTRDLAEGNALVCWRCVHLRSKVLMNGLSFTVTTKDNIYPIAKDVHKAWLLLAPPEPPFVAVHSSSTMQHLAWRTPVTLSKDLIYLRYGPALYTIRPALLNRAMQIAESLSVRAGEAWMTPMFLDRKADEEYHGRLNPKAAPLLTEDEREFFLNLGAGERWALAYLMHSKRPTPEKPEPITKIIASKMKG